MTEIEGLSKAATAQLSDKTKDALAAAAEKDEAEAELVECFCCAGAGKVPPAIPYEITLRGGQKFLTLSRTEPRELSRLVQRARKDNETLLWADGQFTNATEIAHVAIYEGDDGEGDGERGPEAQ